MNIISLDLGEFNSMVCFYGSKSQDHRFDLASTNRRYLKKLLESHACNLVVMEACSASAWITDLCRELGLETWACTRENALEKRQTKNQSGR